MGTGNKELYREKSIHGDMLFPLRVYELRYNSKNNFLHYHWHEELEFIYMERGSYKFKIGNETLVLQEGQVAVVNSEDIHVGLGGISDHCIYYSVVFNMNMLDSPYGDMCHQEYIEPLKAGKYRFPVFISQREAWECTVIEEIRNIITYFTKKPKAYPIFIKASLFRVCAELLSNGTLGTPVEVSRNTQLYFSQFKKIMQYIEKNYQQKISVKELADEIHVCEDYFYKLFKDMTGKTPVQYINQFRINKAIALLNDTDLSVSEIAEATGFGNSSYFIRTFKRFKHCSPVKYRKNR